MRTKSFAALVFGALVLGSAMGWSAEKTGWKHNGTIMILTDSAGTELPAGAELKDFPLLVRLHRDFFDFSETLPAGRDLRFTDREGKDLAFQVDDWDPSAGEASIWVRVPKITGNTRQAIRMLWGKEGASKLSSGPRVFGGSYLSVWHLDEKVRDELGTLQAKDLGTTVTEGMIGKARHFPGGKGITCGDKITSLPTGTASSFTTQAWIQPQKANCRAVGWGNEKAQGKVVMWFRSPPQVQMECYFSDANVAADLPGSRNQWIHVVHTYERGDSRLYLNGNLAGRGEQRAKALKVERPARFQLGGWYGNHDYVGNIDEVRVSWGVRSAEWIAMEYENQKPLQRLTGHLITPGVAFSVSAEKLTVKEGESVKVTAEAGGAQKVSWILKRGGHESVVAVDRFAMDFEAGRVAGDEEVVLQFKAIYPDTVKTKEVRITVMEAIPEPAFTLRAPTKWNGRDRIEVQTEVSTGGKDLSVDWKVEPLAVIKELAPGKLILKRAQNSGVLIVKATMSNGGRPTTHAVKIEVQEPEEDAWVARKPAAEEWPEEGQFYARDDSGSGTLFYAGVLTDEVEAVYLKLFADGKLVKKETAAPAADGSYLVSAKLKAGLVKYRTEFGTLVDGRETMLHGAKDLVCGDAYLINGQSNAEASDFGKDQPEYGSEWLRTYGRMGTGREGQERWGPARHRAKDGRLQIGYWGMELGRRLLESQKVPIFLINGAVGGTRIDQHQRNHADPTDLETIYGRVLWRLRRARLTHGIRGVIWHQGENDQGAAGPTGGYGWETYREYFIDLAAAWVEDYPNIQHYHAFQIWPKACSMGTKGSDNRLREVQRKLLTAFSNLSVMSTLGITPQGTCHYPAEGYAEMARLLTPLMERDHYGTHFEKSITAPNLVSAGFGPGSEEELVLEFDQAVVWETVLASQFFLDGEAGVVKSGAVSGDKLTLKLNAPSEAKTITYLDGASWRRTPILRGENGIAALTFCEIPLGR